MGASSDKMPEQVISLTSSDEEENISPPPKKRKLTPLIVPQVTLTLVPKKNEKTIETVSLDSDEDDPPQESTKRNEENLEKTSVNDSEKVEFITLSDEDEDAEHDKAKRVHKQINTLANGTSGITIIKMGTSGDPATTVSLTDSDSDTEVTEEKQMVQTNDVPSVPTLIDENEDGNKSSVDKHEKGRPDEGAKETNNLEPDQEDHIDINESVQDEVKGTKEISNKGEEQTEESRDSEIVRESQENNTLEANESVVKVVEKEVEDNCPTENGSSMDVDSEEPQAQDEEQCENGTLEKESVSDTHIMETTEEITLAIEDNVKENVENNSIDNEQHLEQGKQTEEQNEDKECVTKVQEESSLQNGEIENSTVIEIGDDKDEDSATIESKLQEESFPAKELESQNIETIIEIDEDSSEEENELAKERSTQKTNNTQKNKRKKYATLESATSDEPYENDKSDDTSNDLSIEEKGEESILIDDSDDETEKENHVENVDIEPFPVNLDKTSVSDIPGPSESSKTDYDEAKQLFKKFLKIVEEKIVNSSFEEILPKKLPIIQKYFKRCGDYVAEKVFETILYECIKSVRSAPNSNAANTAVLAFHKVFEHLKSHVTETTIEIEEEHVPKVKKLEKNIKLLRKRIKQLEETEVNFDDDEDSAYIMLDRYQARLKKVYAKYCEYIRRNPYSGRALYDKISFINSKYNVINQAISRKYKNSVNFPSYYELEKYITKIVKREKLDLSELEIKHESKKCFKYLGSVLQKKRRQELYDSHLDFIEFTEDPATKDLSLENILKKNLSEGKEKIEKIYQKYVNKQEQGEDHVSSDDADSSEDSGDSEENNKTTRKKGPKNVKKKSTGKNIKEKKGNKSKSNENEVDADCDNEALPGDASPVKNITIDLQKVDKEVLQSDKATEET